MAFNQLLILLMPSLLGACGMIANMLGAPGLHTEDTFIRCANEASGSERQGLAIEYCKCTKYSSLGQRLDGPWMEKERVSCSSGAINTQLTVPGIGNPDLQASTDCTAGNLVFRYSPAQGKASINGELLLNCVVEFSKHESPSSCQCR